RRVRHHIPGVPQSGSVRLSARLRCLQGRTAAAFGEHSQRCAARGQNPAPAPSYAGRAGGTDQPPPPPSAARDRRKLRRSSPCPRPHQGTRKQLTWVGKFEIRSTKFETRRSRLTVSVFLLHFEFRISDFEFPPEGGQG